MECVDDFGTLTLEALIELVVILRKSIGTLGVTSVEKDSLGVRILGLRIRSKWDFAKVVPVGIGVMGLMRYVGIREGIIHMLIIAGLQISKKS